MSVAQKLLQSSALLVAIRFVQRSLGLVSTLVLARLLTPEDFGIVAVAALIIHFSEVLSNSGIQQYLVQVTEVSEEVVNTAWTLDLSLKTAIGVLLYLLLPGVSWLYDNPNIMYALAVLIPVIPLRAFMNPELHLHRRDLNYRIIFKIGIFQKFVSFISVIVIALWTESFWAIIVGDLVSSLVAVGLSHYYCAHRPRISFANAGSQWVFSRWMLARGSIGYLRSQIDTLLISQFYSLSVLGKFNIAREFTIMPANEIIQPAVEPLLATFSTVRTDYERLAKQFSTGLLLVSVFTAPFVGFIYVFNEPIVFYVLGEQWIEAAPFMKAMTPLLLAFGLGGILNNLCFALAKVKLVFWYDVMSLFVIATTLFMIRGSVISEFLWIRSFLGLTAIIVFLFICSRLIKTQFYRKVLLILTPVFLAITASFISYDILFRDTFISLVFCGVAFLLAYLFMVVFVARVFSHRSYAWASIVVYGAKTLELLNRK